MSDLQILFILLGVGLVAILSVAALTRPPINGGKG